MISWVISEKKGRFRNFFGNLCCFRKFFILVFGVLRCFCNFLRGLVKYLDFLAFFVALEGSKWRQNRREFEGY